MESSIAQARGYAFGPNSGNFQWYGGSMLDWKASAATTGGTFTFVDQLARQGNDPPLHIHTKEDEAMFVLEGDLTMSCGPDLWHANPGSFMYLPRNVPHSYMVHSKYARLLILLTPGGMERIYDGLGEPATSRTLGPVPDGEDENYLEMTERLKSELGVIMLENYVKDLLAEGAEPVELS